MDLQGLDRLLNRAPVIVQGMHIASVAYLHEPVRIYPSLDQLVRLLEKPEVIPPHRAIVLDNDPQYSHRFPVVTLDHDPFTPELSGVLFSHYDELAASMYSQVHVADRIARAAERVETVVLVLLDGLSYSDCRNWPGVEPCLAALPTTTRVCFPTIIGDPPIASRLFSRGLTRCVGFTYWNRDEKLTKYLFRSIADTRRLDPSRPNAFSQVVEWLAANDLRATYVQIVRSALDEYAEGHRTAIPKRAVVDLVMADIEAIRDVLQRKGRPAVVFGISDHGIMWKDSQHSFEPVALAGARYTKARGGPGRGRLVEVDGAHYWVLDYPQLGRSWRGNEQGVHGGVSFDEAIVPFISWEVNC